METCILVLLVSTFATGRVTLTLLVQLLCLLLMQLLTHICVFNCYSALGLLIVLNFRYQSDDKAVSPTHM